MIFKKNEQNYMAHWLLSNDHTVTLTPTLWSYSNTDSYIVIIQQHWLLHSDHIATLTPTLWSYSNTDSYIVIIQQHWLLHRIIQQHWLLHCDHTATMKKKSSIKHLSYSLIISFILFYFVYSLCVNDLGFRF